MIAGSFLDDSLTFHGYVGVPAHLVVLSVPGPGRAPGWGTLALTINSANTIAGRYNDTNGKGHGFLLTRDAGWTRFNVPAANYEYPVAINSCGEVAGYYQDTHNVIHGFLRMPDGTITTFDVSDAVETDPESINQSGAIAGYYIDQSYVSHGFIRTP